MGIPPAVVPSRLENVGGEIAYHFRGGAGTSMEVFSHDRGPCVALASIACQANPNRNSVYTRVPAEYCVEHELDASAVVCRSNLCHAKVGLRGAPRQAGRPVGWRKRTAATMEAVVGTIAKAEHVRPRPAIVTEIFQIKASRCAHSCALTPVPPTGSRMPARVLTSDFVL